MSRVLCLWSPYEIRHVSPNPKAQQTREPSHNLRHTTAGNGCQRPVKAVVWLDALRGVSERSSTFTLLPTVCQQRKRVHNPQFGDPC